MSVESVLGEILTELKAQQTAADEEREERKKRDKPADQKASSVSSGQLQKEINLLNERASIERDLTKRDIKRLAHLTDLKVAQDRLNQAIEDGSNVEQLKIYRENVEKNAGALDKLDEGFKKAAGGRLLFESMAESFLGLSGPLEAVSQALQMGRGGMGDFWAGLRDGLVSGELFIGMSLKMVDSLVSFALETDSVLASFRASTGAGNEFNSVIAGVERSAFAAGVSLEDAAAAVGVLKNAFTDFTYFSEQQQEDLTKTTVLLQKMGLEFSTQGEIFQITTQSMNMSATDTEGFMVDLRSIAQSLGRDVDNLGQDFVQNADFLTRFGEEGVEVFEELAVSAKALGTEIGLLVKVMEGFQTFDDAGASVGRLNAILGGPYLNAMDMLNASYEDPAEGIRMLRDGFDQAGRSIEDFSGAELMAVSSAMGLSLTETKELLGETNEEMEIRRMKEEELAEAAAKTQGITEALNNAWKALYINMEPLITNIFIPLTGWISGTATALGELTQSTGGIIAFGTVLGAVFGAGIGLMMAFTTAIPFVGAAMAAITWPAVLTALAWGTGLGALAGGLAGTAAASAMEGGGSSSYEPPKFASGGVVQGIPMAEFAGGGTVQGTSVAMVGEQGPEMVEMPVGTRVTSAPATKNLTDAIKNLSHQLNTLKGGSPGTQQIAVYIGQEKIDEIVVKALNSSAAQSAFGPFTNA